MRQSQRKAAAAGETGMKQNKYIIIVLLGYPLVCFSSRLLLWLVPPAGEVEWKTSLLTVRGVVRAPRILPTEGNHVHPPLSDHSLLSVSCRGRTQHILRFFSLRTWHFESFPIPQQGLAIQECLTFVRRQSVLRNSQSARGSLDY